MTPTRNGPGRRQEDADALAEREFDRWAAVLIQHRAKIITIACTLSGGLVFLLTTIGMRIAGPVQDVQALDRKFTITTDTLSARMTRVERAVSDGSADRADIKATLNWVIYMECRQARRADPNDVVPICETMRRP